MIARVLICFSLLATPALAQGDRAGSLADIRQDLTVLYVELQRLKTELNTTGAAQGGATAGTVLDRVAAIESELQRLTAKTEELEFRIDRVVRDGTNRVGDLEFRLCELEETCDIATLGDTPSLGGDAETLATALPPANASPDPAAPQLAAPEEEDFGRAETALAAGEFASAADQFATFNQNYPGGPLEAAAELGRGEALEGMGDMREAARAYLAAFSVDQNGPVAPDALYHLGAALGRLGKTNEACVTLAEVARRYPQANDAGLEAASAMRNIGCN